VAEVPDTLYARSRDGGHIAYQVVGDGPLDVVYVPSWWGHVDGNWEEPTFARFLRRLASFSRLILFDKRGTGASDPLPASGLVTWEDWVDDVCTVMAAVDSERAAVIGVGYGGPVALLFAATYPRQTSALVLFNTSACLVSSDGSAAGLPPDLAESIIDEAAANWGSGAMIETLHPSRADDDEFRRWWSKYQRMSGTPTMSAAMTRLAFSADARSLLPAIQAPTLVMHRRDFALVQWSQATYLAEHISGARSLELSGTDGAMWTEPDWESIADEVQEFVTGVRPAPLSDRVLATVLFTDLVGSTETAARLGDRRWREVLDRHHVAVRDEIAKHRGQEVKSTGDGFLATFDGPARAILCAKSVVERLSDLGLTVRAGLHTGEVELHDVDLAGIAVHIAARVNALAAPGEVLVSRTVKDLVAGSGLQFTDRGLHALKGVPEKWQLFAVES
jgi:class 3 adenylate cyclase